MVHRKIAWNRTRYPHRRFRKKLLVPLIRKLVARDLIKTLRAWRISAAQRHALLGLTAFQYEEMKHGGMIPSEKDALSRIVHIRKINHALHSLLGKNSKNISHWLNTHNNGNIFRGKKAILFMCENSKNLLLTRQYLEYHAHGGW